MDLPRQRELIVARRLLVRAALLTKKVLATVDHISKSDASPVTIADFAVQALLITALHAAFPDHGFVGEEDAATLREDAHLREQVWKLVSSVSDEERLEEDGEERLAVPKSSEEMLEMIDKGGQGRGGRRGKLWVMDPIDGTATFLRGEQYAISLALLEDGQEVLGLLSLPNLQLDEGRVKEKSIDESGLGIMLWASRGHGAMTQRLDSSGNWIESPRKLEKLTSPSETKEYHIVDCYASSATDHEFVRRLASRMGTSYPGTDCWSSHVRYAALVLGGGDLQLRVPFPKTRFMIWDHAGAQLIFTEVGGKVTDLDGKDIDFGAGRDLSQNRGMLAAREDIHARVRDLVTKMLAE